nr:uncharacterized protein [Tanacetum cinerariifolium]
MHYRSVAIERLPFHEEWCNRVYFRGDDDVNNVIQRETASMSKFTEWMKANEMYPELGSTLTFRIPMELDNESCCGIDVISDLTDLIRVADLIIWDEALVQHRHAFEAVDRTLGDIYRLDNPNVDNKIFDGKVVMLGGDFRQIIPVILNASRAVVVSSAVNKSLSVWDYSIGDSRLSSIALDGEDDATWITNPKDLLVIFNVKPVGAIVSSTFLDLLNRIQDINWLKEKCILSSTNDVFAKINSHVLASMSGQMHELLSADTICSTTDNLEDILIESVSFTLGTESDELKVTSIADINKHLADGVTLCANDSNWIVDYLIDHLCTQWVVLQIKIDKYNLAPTYGKAIVEAEPVVVETHVNDFTHDESSSLPKLAFDVNKDVCPPSSSTIEPDEMSTRGNKDKMMISVDEAAINQ